MSDTITITIVIADKATGPARQAAEAVDDLGKAAGEAAPKLKSLDQVVVGALRRVGELATNAMANAGAALLSFGQSSLAAAANFEDAMGDVAAVSGATGEDFARLRETALQLGSETAFSASQAAEGMKLLAQAGFGVNETIDAMPGVLSAAAAGGVDLATAADVVANTLRGFGLAADESAHVADVLALAANRSNTDITGLGEALKYAGPVAAALGISMEDATAAIGRMSDAGIKGSMAGTALRGILTRLAAPSKEAAAEMDRLGISVFDAQGQMLPLPELVGHLTERMAGLTDSQRTAALATMVGQEAMSGFLALMKAGPENLADFSAALSDAGGAAAGVAAIQLADFNGAMEALGGSIETFQIELVSGALPALAGFVNEGLIPAVNAATDALPALFGLADVLSGAVLPAFVGLGGAALAYAAVHAPTLIAAAMSVGAAWTAKAAAMLASLGPYALVAAAVGGVAWAVSDFTEKTRTATEQLLASRQWWTDAAAAIDQYEDGLQGASTTIDATAATIRTLRDQIATEVEILGQRMAAGLVSEEQYRSEMAVINAKAEALQVATGFFEGEVAALHAQAAASMTATEQLGAMTAGHTALAPIVTLTIEEIEKLGKQIQQTYQQGGQALLAFAETEAAFLAGVEERRAAHEATMAKLIAEREQARTAEQQAAIDERIAAEEAAYQTQEQIQAAAYAEQQAAQRAHLGVMLLDYVNAQVQLGNITAEKAAEITAALVEEYNIQEDTAAATFAGMAAAIDAYASDANGSIDDLIGTLRDNEQAAVETEQAMTAMAKEYVATAVANFAEKRQDAETYARALREIPSRIETEVHTKYTESKPGGGGGKPQQAMALGGPAVAATPYLVGEHGPELFVPDTGGRIIPAGETAALLRGGGDPGGALAAGPLARVAAAGETTVALTIAPQIAVALQGGAGGGELEAATEELARRTVHMVLQALNEGVDRLIQGGGVP